MYQYTYPGGLGDLVTHWLFASKWNINFLHLAREEPSHLTKFTLDLASRSVTEEKVIKSHKSSLTDIEPSLVLVCWCCGKTKQLAKNVATYCLLEVVWFPNPLASQMGTLSTWGHSSHLRSLPGILFFHHCAKISPPTIDYKPQGLKAHPVGKWAASWSNSILAKKRSFGHKRHFGAL